MYPVEFVSLAMERTLWYKSKILLPSKIKEQKRSFPVFLLSLNPGSQNGLLQDCPGAGQVGSSCWWPAATSRVRWESCVDVGWGSWGWWEKWKGNGKDPRKTQVLNWDQWPGIFDTNHMSKCIPCQPRSIATAESQMGMGQLKNVIFHAPRWAFSCLLVCVETDLGLMRSNLFQIHRFLFNN